MIFDFNKKCIKILQKAYIFFDFGKYKLQCFISMSDIFKIKYNTCNVNLLDLYFSRRHSILTRKYVKILQKSLLFAILESIYFIVSFKAFSIANIYIPCATT